MRGLPALRWLSRTIRIHSSEKLPFCFNRLCGFLRHNAALKTFIVLCGEVAGLLTACSRCLIACLSKDGATGSDIPFRCRSYPIVHVIYLALRLHARFWVCRNENRHSLAARNPNLSSGWFLCGLGDGRRGVNGTIMPSRTVSSDHIDLPVLLVCGDQGRGRL